jgi:hypothetical protein
LVFVLFLIDELTLATALPTDQCMLDRIFRHVWPHTTGNKVLHLDVARGEFFFIMIEPWQQAPSVCLPAG